MMTAIAKKKVCFIMGTWNHRVYKKNIIVDGKLLDVEYSIREHHTFENGDTSYSVEPEAAASYASDRDENGPEDPIESLRWQLSAMLDALDKPVLEDKVTDDE